jgi:uroporphyrinogen-III synthase
MNEKPIVLSTKILPEIQKQELQKFDFVVLDYNFIEVISTVVNKKYDLEKIKKNLIFTSQNAVLSVLENENVVQLKTKPVFCVGLKTKALLEENGFEVAVYVDYAEDLAEIITLIYKEDSFTFFSGNLRKDLLPKTLKKARIDFSEIEVYETKLSPKKIKEKVDAILFFSPSAVESYLIDNKITKEICFCIGNTTAEALVSFTKNIIVADYPSIESVIEDCVNEFA